MASAVFARNKASITDWGLQAIYFQDISASDLHKTKRPHLGSKKWDKELLCAQGGFLDNGSIFLLYIIVCLFTFCGLIILMVPHLYNSLS